MILDKDGFIAIIQPLTGLSPGAVVWGLDPQPMIGDLDRAIVRFEVFNVAGVGVDEHRRSVSNGNDGYPAGTFWTLEIGNRDIVISIRVEAFDRSIEAAEIIDRVRTGIRADAVTAQLDAIKIAFVRAERTVRLPTMYDNRVVNAAQADFTFAGIGSVVSQIVPPGVGGDYIDTVNGNNIVPWSPS